MRNRFHVYRNEGSSGPGEQGGRQGKGKSAGVQVEATSCSRPPRGTQSELRSSRAHSLARPMVQPGGGCQRGTDEVSSGSSRLARK